MAAATLASSVRWVVRKVAVVLRRALWRLSAEPHHRPWLHHDAAERTEENMVQLLWAMQQRIEAALDDAEERDVRSSSAELWLRELKGVACDVEDALDECQYRLVQLRVEGRWADGIADSSSFQKKRKIADGDVSSGLPIVCDGSCALSAAQVVERVREIKTKMEEITKDRLALSLRDEDGERRPAKGLIPAAAGGSRSSSLIDESSVLGREGDREKASVYLIIILSN